MSNLANLNLFKDMENLTTLSSRSMQALTPPKYHDILQNLHKYSELLDIPNISRKIQEINSHFELINKLSKNPILVTDNISYILKQLKHLDKGIYQSEFIDIKSILAQNVNLFEKRQKIFDLDYIKQIQDILSPIQKSDNPEAILANKKLQEVTTDIKKGKEISYGTWLLLIFLFWKLFIWSVDNYPNLKEIYKDATYDPIQAICGTLVDLEKK